MKIYFSVAKLICASLSLNVAPYPVSMTARNTLEGKQFFKSEHAAREFARTAEERNYRPPYSFLFTIDIDDDCFDHFRLQPQILDGFEAITVNEDDLPAFNNCINFTNNNAL